MITSFFTVLSPAKFGRLYPYCVREVSTWLLELHFLSLIDTFDVLKVIEVFPDGLPALGDDSSLTR
jgi:hypothetical protein